MKKLIILFFCFPLIACTGKDIDANLKSVDEATTRNVKNSEVINKNENNDNKSSYTFSEDRSFLNEDFEIPNEIVPLEEIAHLIQQYLIQMVELPESTPHFNMRYGYNHHIDIHKWYGEIYLSEEDFEQDKGEEFPQNYIATVLMDAKAGDMLEFGYFGFEPLKGITFDKAQELSQSELLEIFPEPDEDEINEMKEHVQKYASIHYPHSPIKEIYYGRQGPDGNPITDYQPSPFISFFLFYEDDNYVDITLQRETNIIFMILRYSPEVKEKFYISN